MVFIPEIGLLRILKVIMEAYYISIHSHIEKQIKRCAPHIETPNRVL